MGVVRKTKSVDLLLDQFKSGSKAISVIELVDRLSSKLNKTTIYRVLNNLEDDGVLHSFLGVNSLKWYAKCSGCSKTKHSDIHPHFQCTVCGKVDCLPVKMTIPEIPTHDVKSIQVLINGACTNCRA